MRLAFIFCRTPPLNGPSFFMFALIAGRVAESCLFLFLPLKIWKTAILFLLFFPLFVVVVTFPLTNLRVP